MPSELESLGGILDLPIFEQLLEMDDEGDHEFSESIVINFYEQAEQTFGEMDAAFEKKDLPELSRLGHFLKGSAAAIGVNRVRNICEKMQHWGHSKNEDGSKPITDKEALDLIEGGLKEAKEGYAEAELALKKFYEK